MKPGFLGLVKFQIMYFVIASCTTLEGTRISKSSDVRMKCSESLDVLSSQFALVGCTLTNHDQNTINLQVKNISLSAQPTAKVSLASSQEMTDLLTQYQQEHTQGGQSLANLAPMGVIFTASAAGSANGGEGSGIAMIVLATTSHLLKTMDARKANHAAPLTDKSSQTLPTNSGMEFKPHEVKNTYIAVKYGGELSLEGITLCLEHEPIDSCTTVPVELNSIRARQRPQ